MAVVMVGALATAEAPARRVIETVVAKVNDEVITQSSFDRSFAPIQEQIQQKYGNETGKMMEALRSKKDAFLETMVDNLLLTQRSRSLGFKVAEDEIREVIERLMAEHGLKSQEDLVLALKGEGIDFEDFKADLKNQGFREKLIQQEIIRKIGVTEAELKGYYEDHMGEFAVPVRVHLREIGLGSDAATAAALWDKAQGAMKAGKSFAQVAEEMSLAPSRDKGGDLGWFAKGDLDPAVESAVAALKAGQTTGIVTSSYGAHVFLLEERQEAGSRSLDDVKGDVEEKIRRKKYDDSLDALLQKLREEADIRYKNAGGVLVEARSLKDVKGS